MSNAIIDAPVVVIDNGTGYTKMGFSSDNEPQFVIPTAIAVENGYDLRKTHGSEFYIGDEAFDAAGYSVKYPISNGLVNDWYLMGEYWEQCIFKYLKCKPEEHYFLITESSLNTPKNRQYTAEIMFEAFGCPGLYIAEQSVLALYSSWICKKQEDRESTGVVIDSGDGVTNIVPIVDHNVIDSCVRQLPISGRDITKFIQNLLKSRESRIPPGQVLKTANQIKEQFCYVCPNAIDEFKRYDQDQNKWFKKYEGVNRITQKLFCVDVGYERFLGPEVFFKPKILNSNLTTSLSKIVDDVIQSCPIDLRRDLYKNIVLSGGNTMFKNFDKRLKNEIQFMVDKRLKHIEKSTKHKPNDIEVKVNTHKMQRYAAWFGGSVYSSIPDFFEKIHTKARYFECGANRFQKLCFSI